MERIVVSTFKSSANGQVPIYKYGLKTPFLLFIIWKIENVLLKSFLPVIKLILNIQLYFYSSHII